MEMDLFRHQRSYLSTEKPLGIHLTDEVTVSNFEDTYDYKPDENSDAMRYRNNVYITSITFSILISITGISFLAFILAKKELRKIPTLWLVINILVAVIFEGLVMLPVMAGNVYEFKGDQISCHIVYILYAFHIIHTQFSLTLLFIDRFVCFVKPERYAEVMRPKVVQILIGCFILLELIFSVTVTFTLTKPMFTEDYGDKMCYASSSSTMMFIYVLLSSGLPMLINAMFGLITIVGALVMCHRLTKSSDKEASESKQALGLILLLVLFDLGLIFPYTSLFIPMIRFDFRLAIILQCLYTSFYFIVNFILMLLIPDIRAAVASCCRPEKKGETMPLVKPT